jgi:2-polyprenyl-3-methyl-5-hydroxy-6-metoxy-1,4-benzoquinol methylase
MNDMIEVPCAICKSSDSKKILTGYDKYLHVDKKRFDLVRCNKCTLVYLYPQPSIAELARYYPPHYPSYLPEYSVLEKSPTLEFIKRAKRFLGAAPKPDAKKKEEPAELATKKKVLDFGCGRGDFLVRLHKQHPKWELIGFDISANKDIKKIGESIKIYYDEREVLAREFAPGTFDEIHLCNVLEHLNDPKETLTMLASLLKAGGEMVIEVPNIDSIKLKIFGSNFFCLEIPRHLYHFNIKTLRLMCAEADLKVTSHKIAGSAKSTVRSIYFALGIHKDTLNPIHLYIADKATKLLGETWINDDSIFARIGKA